MKPIVPITEVTVGPIKITHDHVNAMLDHMVTIIESDSSNYWCKPIKVSMKGAPVCHDGTPDSNQSDTYWQFEIVEQESSTDAPVGVYDDRWVTQQNCFGRTLDPYKLIQAAADIASGKGTMHNSHRGQFLEFLVNPDECDLDAGAVDLIVQMAVLGDIVYG